MSSGGDPWSHLRRFTDARIGLGRAGAGMPTREVLDFTFAHAMARDAVLTPLDWTGVETSIAALGFETVHASSAVEDRAEYLRRPDLGRKLATSSRDELTELGRALKPKPDVAIMIGDGLSSKAITVNVAPFLSAFTPYIEKKSWTLTPVVLAHNARVALGDDVAASLGAKSVIVLIGERPGLSSPDSLGVYMTFQPRTGLKDADRNCISNIRVRGLSYGEAAYKLAWLLDQAFKRKLSGVNLKDEAGVGLEGKHGPELLT